MRIRFAAGVLVVFAIIAPPLRHETIKPYHDALPVVLTASSGIR
jgi:hypothetical protein